MKNIKTTVLSDIHRKLGAQMVPFGGFEMPLQYESIIKEHLHTRKRVSLFDVSHMGILHLQGSTAFKNVMRLVAGRVDRLEIGQCTYGFLLNEYGGIIDDLITYRLGDTEFYLVVNASTTEKDAAWIKSHLSEDIVCTNLSGKLAKLDLQGPDSARILSELGIRNLNTLGYFRFREEKIGKLKFIISRSGYTGELGYELYSKGEYAKELWNLLLDFKSVAPAGLGARDTLRLEAGYPLYGHELNEDRTPVEAGFSKFIDTTANYIGKSAVESKKHANQQEQLIGFKLAGRQAARHGDMIFAGMDKIGSVTSGCYSPSLGFAIGMGYVKKEYSMPNVKFEIQARTKRLEAECVQVPFYKQGTVRQKVSL